jgi:hypothetical protein
MSCVVLFCVVLSCAVLSCLILYYLILSCLILSYLILSSLVSCSVVFCLLLLLFWSNALDFTLFLALAFGLDLFGSGEVEKVVRREGVLSLSPPFGTYSRARMAAVVEKVCFWESIGSPQFIASPMVDQRSII